VSSSRHYRPSLRLPVCEQRVPQFFVTQVVVPSGTSGTSGPVAPAMISVILKESPKKEFFFLRSPRELVTTQRPKNN
jgi:hypothetical protein